VPVSVFLHGTTSDYYSMLRLPLSQPPARNGVRKGFVPELDSRTSLLKKGTGTSRGALLGGVVGDELGASPLFQQGAMGVMRFP
jgi:hypothetical protein